MLYVSHVSADLSVVSGWPYDRDVSDPTRKADLARADEQIKTPFAMAILADGHNGVWAAHKQGTSIVAATKTGWRVIRWGWSCHGFQSSDYSSKQDGASLKNNYRLLVLGKWFDHKPLPLPESAGRWPWGGSGCSDAASNVWSTVKKHTGHYAAGMPKSIFTYHGPPLNAAEYKKALADGWWRIPKTNVMLWAQKPSLLTPEEKERFHVKELYEDSD